jgi:hypothetical protein
MSALARQQQALLDALLAWPVNDAMKNIAAYAIDTGARGIKAYQMNGHMLAQRALQAAYPVVAQIVGDASFADLARALWHAQPPQRGDIACWGAGLADFVQASAQLQDEPYLSDVARAEWALHQCAAAPDHSPDRSTMALLTTHDPEQLGLLLAPGCAVVRSAWPVASVLGAHLYQTPNFTTVGQQLRDALAQDAVVWRVGWRPLVREAAPGEAIFLSALMRGGAVSRALEVSPTLNFSTWLPAAVQSGLLLCVTILPR